jgi:hypothetical protein
MKSLDQIGWIVEICLPWAGGSARSVVWEMDIAQVTSVARMALGSKDFQDRLADRLKAKHVGEAMSEKGPGNGKDADTKHGLQG